MFSVVIVMLILDGPWSVVHHDEPLDCIDVVWKKFTPSRDLRGVLVAMRERLARPPRRWFLDHTRMKVLAPPDHDWVVDGWLLPWVGERPCRGGARVAFVNSIDVFGRRSVERLAARLGDALPKVLVGVFNGRGDARSFLADSDELAGSNG